MQFTEKVSAPHCCVQFTEDSLECEAALRTGAEVLGVVETNHLAGAAGTRHAREEAGGSTFAALLLLVWESLVVHLPGVHDPLGRRDHTRLSFWSNVGLMSERGGEVPEMYDLRGKKRERESFMQMFGFGKFHIEPDWTKPNTFCFYERYMKSQAVANCNCSQYSITTKSKWVTA